MKIRYLISVPVWVLLFVNCNRFSKTEEKAEEKAPNILFVLADDASFLHMGKHSPDWVTTPAFDKIVEQGVYFENAYTPNAKCAPSRAAVLTGRNSWQLEEAANHMAYFPTKFKSFPEVLYENGYHVGYTGKGYLPGVAYDEKGEKRELLVKSYNKFKKDAPTSEISDNDYPKNFETFLEKRKEDQPFFFWYGGWEPHRSYEFGSGLKNGKKLSEVKEVFDFWPKTDSVKTDILDYAFELEYFDSQLEKMLDLLEEKNLIENTIIVVTSDNGMPFPRIKGQTYELSNHLPLAIMWPKKIKNKGRTVKDFVNFIDFAPTFLEFAGISEKESGMEVIEGTSLSDVLFSEESGRITTYRDHVLIGKERHDIGRPNNEGYPMRGIIVGDYLYLKNFEVDRWPAGNPETGYLNCDGGPTKTAILDSKGDGKNVFWELSFGKRPPEELYNIKTDPQCLNNLAGKEDFVSLKEDLYQQMEDKLKAQNDPRILGKGEIFDGYPIYPAKFMNYYEKYMNGEDTPKLNWVNKSDFRPEDAD
ncbi:sulfatase family protein [Maribacter thermophilus]|uniref:sulfatase family protein n=1 Tax=Maribacter thermophilus TaxID=1197874 RepID=UPI0006414E5B|nr:sulfatase [Maribacter thermophilus]